MRVSDTVSSKTNAAHDVDFCFNRAHAFSIQSPEERSDEKRSEFARQLFDFNLTHLFLLLTSSLHVVKFFQIRYFAKNGMEIIDR